MPVEEIDTHIRTCPLNSFTIPSFTHRGGAATASLLFVNMGKVLSCESQCQCDLEADCTGQHPTRVFCGVLQYEKTGPANHSVWAPHRPD